MRAKRNTVQAIVQRLNEEADTARRYLDLCELEVLEPRYCDNFILNLLYEILSKKTSQRVRLPEGVFDMTTAVHGIYESETMQTKKIPKKKTAAKSAPAKVKNEKRSKEEQASEKQPFLKALILVKKNPT